MRPPVTVVVHACTTWDLTRQCLDSLRPTLRVRDQVVAVDAGTTDRTAAGLRSSRWLTAVRLDRPTSAATARNAGLRLATGDVVVFLDSDTQVSSRWLDGLVGPLSDDTMAATGPRTNYSAGAQGLASVPYTAGRPNEVSRVARELRASAAGSRTEVIALEGFALAARRADLEQAGGFDVDYDAHEDSDLCLRLASGDRALVVCEDVFVHRHGWAQDGGDPRWLERRSAGRVRLTERHGDRTDGVPTDLLLSACLIVKDEQDRLATCLASLDGLVDEIVVYDTGSTDGTVDLARAAGATVVEGYWDDDFSRARNAALAACSGQWVLHLDADEQSQGDHAAVRADLSARTTEDVIPVTIDNVDDHDVVAFSHDAIRLFRRLRGHWEGRLHEQVAPRAGAALRDPRSRSPLRIRHDGYAEAAMLERGKADRNVRLAEGDLAAAGTTDARALINLGRSLSMAGRHAEAVEHFATARRAATETHWLRQALRYGAEVLIAEGRGEEALEWVAALRPHTTSTAVPDHVESRAHLSLGRSAEALACLSRIDALADVADEDHTVPAHQVQLHRGLALVCEQRWAEGADELLRCLGSFEDPLAWAALVEAQWRSGRPLSAVADLVTDEGLLSVLAHVLTAPIEAADALVDELWTRIPFDARLLAFAAQAAVRLPLERALEWAARLRAAGVARCPLLAIAADPDAEPIHRLRSAAIAFEMFQDPHCRSTIAGAAAALEPTRFLDALAAVDELSPRLLADVVSGAASTPDRRLSMAAVLASVGAEEQARALLSSARA